MAVEIQDADAILIGRLTVEYGELEWLLDYMFSTVVDDDEGRAGIVCGMLHSFSLRLDIVTEVFKAKHEGEEARLKKWALLRKDLEQCNKARNEMIHASWIVDKDVLSRTPRKTGTRKAFPREQLEKELVDVRAVNLSLISFLIRLIHGDAMFDKA